MKIEIPLRLRRDRNGRNVLQGSIEILNLMVFVYVDGETQETGRPGEASRPSRPVLVVRPYQSEAKRAAHKDEEDFRDPWQKAG